MSIDDIQYLKQNSFKQSYSFIIDSKDRNYLDFRDPNNYTITFDEPFKNVFGLEVIDASVPKTMYNIDKYNNKLFIKINKPNNSDFIHKTIKNDEFDAFQIKEGEYSISTLIKQINNEIYKQYQNDIKINALSTPPEITNKIQFKSQYQFILNMNKSTINKSLGFDLTQNDNQNIHFEYIPEISNDITKYKFFLSKFYEEQNQYFITSPGIVDLIGEKYVILNCPEIEDHSTVSLSYSKHNLGLARFKLGTIGYNDENISINKTKFREFHPIGKFSKMTLQFKTQQGFLYDFKGANHNITFNIHYYQAHDINLFNKSILNPNYNPNFLKYKIDYQLNNNSESQSESQSESESNSNSKSESD